MTQLPQPMPARLEHPIRYLFTDVDDTLTWKGTLPVETYIALDRLQDAGIQVIAVTGACAGWCDCIVRTWPVKAVIGENGAFWMQKGPSGQVQRHYCQPAAERTESRNRLHKIQQQLCNEYEFAHPTADQPYRETDIAFDIGQQQQVNPEEQQTLLARLEQEKIQARISSIHINAWLGNYNKARTARDWLKQESGRTGRAITKHEVTFIGDSSNDADMFAQFELTFGVANIKDFLKALPRPPRYITSAPGGFGFSQLAECLLGQAFP